MIYRRGDTQVTSRHKVLLLALSVSLLVVAGFSINVVRADWFYFKAEKAMAIFNARHEHRQLTQLDSQNVPYLDQAEVYILSALSIWGSNSAYLSLYAQVVVWRGYIESDPAVRKRRYQAAIELLKDSLRSRPSHAETWGRLAEYKVLAGQRDLEMHQAREKAFELGGANVNLVNRMMKL